jgi:hypothetical protein
MKSTDLLLFCPQCFASNEDGSQGQVIASDQKSVHTICYNCGLNDGAVVLPRGAIESIRKQASWVGKRYYPHAEDMDAIEERYDLLRTIKVFPGRSAKQVSDEKYWEVKQLLPDGSSVACYIDGAVAHNAEEAIEASRRVLIYIPEEKLKGPKAADAH